MDAISDYVESLTKQEAIKPASCRDSKEFFKGFISGLIVAEHLADGGNPEELLDSQFVAHRIYGMSNRIIGSDA